MELIRTIALAVLTVVPAMGADPATPEPTAQAAGAVGLALEGAGPEYQEACQAFLEAKASDASDRPTYGEVAALFRKVADTAKDGQTRLQCLFLAAVSQFLAGDAEAAGSTAGDALALLPEAHPQRLAAAKTAQLAVAGGGAPAPDVESLSRLLGLTGEADGLFRDLHRLAETRARHRHRVEARWQRHSATMVRRINEWAEQEELAGPDVADLHTRMAARFRPRGYVDLAELENALVEVSLDILTK